MEEEWRLQHEEDSFIRNGDRVLLYQEEHGVYLFGNGSLIFGRPKDERQVLGALFDIAMEGENEVDLCYGHIIRLTHIESKAMLSVSNVGKVSLEIQTTKNGRWKIIHCAASDSQVGQSVQNGDQVALFHENADHSPSQFLGSYNEGGRVEICLQKEVTCWRMYRASASLKNENCANVKKEVAATRTWDNDVSETNRALNRYYNEGTDSEPVLQEGSSIIHGQNGTYTILTDITPELAQKLYAQTGWIVPLEGGKTSTQYVSNRGKFGQLRLGQDSIGQFVGIKEVVGSKVRFSREEARIQALGHGIPQVMPVLDAVETWDTTSNTPKLYVMMPLATLGNGKKLVGYLHSGKIDAKFRMEVIGHVAQALSVGLRDLHARGVYHLDVKPSNFVVDTGGNVQIIDFGCAKTAVDGQFDKNAIGDSRYFSPERRNAKESTDNHYHGAGADSWALGMTMLKLVAGKFSSWHYERPQEHPYVKEIFTSPEETLYQQVVRGLLMVNPVERMSSAQAAEILGQLPPIPPAILDYLREFAQTSQSKEQKNTTQDRESQVDKRSNQDTGNSTSYSVQQIPPPHFTGIVHREAEAYLKAKLVEPDQFLKVKFTACHGMGGIGKTTLATAMVHDPEIQQRYHRIWWIRSADFPGSIASQLANAAKELRLVGDQATMEEAVVKTCKFLESQQEPWLLVLDNAGDSESIREELLPSRGGHVLVTSRDPSWEGVNLPVMNEKEALDVFTKAFPDRNLTLERDDWNHLVKELGYLPLAITQAAAYIRKQQISPGEYLTRFQAQKADMLRVDTPLFGKDLPHSIVTLYGMQLSALKTDQPLAMQLLKASSLMTPEDIPLSVLVGCLDPGCQVDAAIESLVQYGLWQKAGESVSIHRLIQEVLRISLDEGEFQQLLTRLCKELHRFHNDINNLPHLDQAAQYLRIKPHQESLLYHGRESLLSESLDWSKLLNDCGDTALYVTSNHRQALSYYTSTLAIEERILGKDHPHVAMTLSNLGNAYGDMGQYTRKKELLERALVINEREFGNDSVQVASALANLGSSYGYLGMYQKKKDLLERGLAIEEREYGSEHFQVAITLGNLGNVYGDLGTYAKQKQLLERALAIEEREYGPEHLEVAVTLANLADSYGYLGHYAKKQELLERALKIMEREYGADHLQLAGTLTSLGNVHGPLGHYEKQKSLLERALVIKEREYGPDHVQVAITLTGLGDAYGNLGYYEMQKELLERALAIKEREYGLDHVQVAITLTSLGNAYGSLGNYEKQKEVLERAMVITERAYGPDHVQVAITLTSLGDAYGSLGYHEKQKELLQRAVAINEREYGMDHVEVAITLTSLGNAYGSLGLHEKQKELLERALVIKESHYGRDHVQTAITLAYLGRALGSLGNLDKMTESYQNAYHVLQSTNMPLSKTVQNWMSESKQ